MSGPAPKHPSVRARRNDPKKDFTSLPAQGRPGKAPAWPLQPDVKMTAEHQLALYRVANLQVEIEGTEDGRTKGRLRRSLAAAELTAATLALQIEQATDAERELWDELWSTPQATMWEASSAFARMLAQFVRWNIKAEQGDLKAAAEARARYKDFGLTPSTLTALKVEIERADEAETRGTQRRAGKAPAASGRPDPRKRLRSVG
ncbi:MAG: phage terminase small subunit [Mycobacteriaceae bacterium]